VQGPTEFLVTPLLVGPVCLFSQGRFEEPFIRTVFTGLLLRLAQ